MRYTIALLLTLSCLTACATAPSKVPESVRLILPAITPYTADEQNKIADELEKCGPLCSATKQAIKDYKKMRDETRAALDQLK